MKRTIAALDAETDPFLHGRIPKPFAWGLYDGVTYHEFWGDYATHKLLKFLREHDEPLTIYAHNGGKFDFLFFVSELQGRVRLINGRIVEAKLYHHTIRDSFAILPVPLSASGEKLEIDYKKFERGEREKHKPEILDYLRQDCKALHNLVSAFMEEFGTGLTIGGVAMRKLKEFHPFDNNKSPAYDAYFRQYYFGGRCQCFESGIIKTQVKLYDVNSSYPDTMKSKLHPYTLDHTISKTINKKTSFVRWVGQNHNAVPMRLKDGLSFEIERGEFYTSIHEFNVALEHGLIVPEKIVEAIHFSQNITLDDFVDHFYGARLAADANGDEIRKLFYKLVLNSGYGKYAQNPEKFEDSVILPWGEVAPIPYEIAFRHGDYAIWSKPSNQKTYFNIATGASITGGARATLLHGLINSVRPLYCDTDGIACEELTIAQPSKKLGAWKLETEGTMMAIAGKKLYVILDGHKPVKWASKGVFILPSQILGIARGKEREVPSEAPTFKLDGNHQFITRTIKRTAKIKTPGFHRAI